MGSVLWLAPPFLSLDQQCAAHFGQNRPDRFGDAIFFHLDGRKAKRKLLCQ